MNERRKDVYYASADQRTRIHAREWLPEGCPKAVIQISHGITENMGRYEGIAEYFVKMGYAVVGNDHLGHGQSIENSDSFMYCGHWEWLVEDTWRLLCFMKHQYPGLPYYIVGFSLGSFVMRDLLAQHPDCADAAVLIGTGFQARSQLSAAKALVSLETKRVGENHTSKWIQALSFGTYNRYFKPNRTDFDWLCEDTGSLDEYIRDENCGKYISAGLFRELLRGMMRTGKQDAIEKIRMNLPILLLSGEKDPVGEMGKGVARIQNAFRKADMEKVSVRMYPGRHDILHDSCGNDVLKDMGDWLESRMSE
ncbi:MAG: alpha/beta hydrolase [Lachnospiraceae bacterium]|nr:alpha/beta hydrolase [Lachnospiraceae bacterium]